MKTVLDIVTLDEFFNLTFENCEKISSYLGEYLSKRKHESFIETNYSFIHSFFEPVFDIDIMWIHSSWHSIYLDEYLNINWIIIHQQSFGNPKILYKVLS